MTHLRRYVHPDTLSMIYTVSLTLSAPVGLGVLLLLCVAGIWGGK